MPALPPEIVALLGAFANEFTRPTWEHVKILVIGAILCRGPRRVSTVLRTMGLSQESGFEKYHHVLSRAKWQSLALGGILLGLLVNLLPADYPLLIAVDETLERRWGKRIKAKGCYRDAVRSSQTRLVTCYGLKWNVMALLVPLPWSSRVWALPFLTVLESSTQCDEAENRRHKTSIDWTVQMVCQVCRWLKQRPWILLADGGYASLKLVLCCICCKVTLVCRLRMDSQLYEFPKEQSAGKLGRKPIKGERIHLKSLVDDDNLALELATINWYGNEKREVKLLSQVVLWHSQGYQPATIKYVLVVDPQGHYPPEVFFSTDVNLAAAKIVEYYVLRWNLEVTFEEARAHMGLETQRQWSDNAIARTTPALLGLMSLVTLMAHQLKEKYSLKPVNSAWYTKDNSECKTSDLI